MSRFMRKIAKNIAKICAPCPYLGTCERYLGAACRYVGGTEDPGIREDKRGT